jgi:hypothetical protein
MDSLYIAPKTDIYFSPLVDFNAITGVCELVGEAYLENPLEFYTTLKNWVEAYEGQTLTFNFKLSYFSTSSSNAILNLLRAFKKKAQEGKIVQINWYYPEDDESVLVEGQDFMKDLKIDFTIIPYS